MLYALNLKHGFDLPNYYFCNPLGMIKAKTHIASAAMGVIVALAVIASQLFYPPHQSLQKKETTTEQSEEENSESQLCFSVPSSTVPSSAQVELNPNVFLLFEILFKEKNTESPQFNISIPVSQCFRTLFGLAISPNAP